MKDVLDYHRKELEIAKTVIDNENRMFSDAAVAQAQIRAAKHRALIRQIEAAMEELGPRRRVRHKKRGSAYAVVGEGIAQCETPIEDNDALVVYRSPEGGMYFVRKPDEFEDGRFEDLEDAHVG